MAEACKFRVQYVDDLDPFNVVASVKHAEPTVAKKFEFQRDVPLCDQLAAVKKLLRAPHKVGRYPGCVEVWCKWWWRSLGPS